MRQFALLFLLLIGLVGCFEKPSPIVSGEVVDGGRFGQFIVGKPGRQSKSWQLTTEQLHQTEVWLKKNQSGMAINFASTPMPTFSIVLKHVDGSLTQLDLYSANESWQHAITVTNSTHGEYGIKNISTHERDALLDLARETSQ